MNSNYIAIDASKATKKFLSGTEYYTQEIIKGIVIASSTNDNITLYSKDPIGNILGDLPAHVHNQVLKRPSRLWTQVRLSWETFVRPSRALFIPAHTIPIITRSPIVTTLHDLGFKHYPELYPRHELFYHNFSMNMAVRRAKKIIAISEFTKQDILKWYPFCNAEKITVVHHGYNKNRFAPLKQTDSLKFRNKYDKYILFIGRLEEKKNVLGMVKAFALLRKERSVRHKLVLAGRAKFGFGKVEEYINTLPADIKKDIVITGYVSDDDLPVLLREADIFLFTTFFEGFGMPILEAFASGVPVVASNTTSIPEVAGNAALLVDPNKTLDIASACSKIINQPHIKKKLIRDGLARCHQFSWEKAGAKTFEVIKDVADNKGN